MRDLEDADSGSHRKELAPLLEPLDTKDVTFSFLLRHLPR